MGQNLNGYNLPGSRENLEVISNYRNNRNTRDVNNVIIEALISAQELTMKRGMQVIEQLGADIFKKPTHLNFDGVLVKPVSDLCNLNCSYCYEGKGLERKRSKMSYQTLEELTIQILKYCKTTISWSWHGGEPLLRGIDFYREAILLQKKHNIKGVKIKNSIQTNGTLINKDWVIFFRENDFVVGISIDGSKDIHDDQRVDFNGNGSFDIIKKNVQLLLDFGLVPRCISVLNSENMDSPEEYFKTMLSLGFKSFDIHPSFGFDGSISESKSNPKSYSEFMVSLFNIWKMNNDSTIRIRPFDEFFRAYIGERPTLCFNSGTCSSIIAINADGNVIPCTRPFHGDEFIFGNVNRSSLTEILKSPKWNNFVKDELIGQRFSKECEWGNLCFGGCPQHRYSDNDQDITASNYFCSCQNKEGIGLGLLWKELLKNIDEELCNEERNICSPSNK